MKAKNFVLHFGLALVENTVMEDKTIFHQIIDRKIPADIVFEDERVIAFKDIQPAAPEHILIVPKRTIPTANDITSQDEALIGHMVFVAKEYAKQVGVSEDGYRLVINCNENGAQTVFQLHLHLLAGRQMSWPPG